MDSLSDEKFFKIMNKLVDWKTKFEFVMRYINGESALKLGRELRSHWDNPTQQIYFWWQLYLKAGVSALKPKPHDQKLSTSENVRLTGQNLLEKSLLKLLRFMTNLLTKIKQINDVISFRRSKIIVVLFQSKNYAWCWI